MAGKSRQCEICGVKESFRGGFFASFPIDEFRCKTWVRLVGKEDLVHIPIEKLHEIRHICGDHFEKKDFGKSGKKLKKRAYPKLQLSAPPLSDNQMMGFPQHVASKNVPAANPTIPAEFALEVPMESTPSTSRETLSTAIIPTMNVPVANPTIPAESALEVPMESTPSTSRETLSTPIIPNMNAIPAAVTVDHVPVVQKSRKRPLAASGILNTIDSGIPSTSNSTETAAKRIKLSEADFNMTKEDLIRHLKEVKSTIRSLKKNAKVMERLESPSLKEIVSLALKNQKKETSRTQMEY